MASHSGPPVKLWYRIGEVSSIVGVAPHVLRYWETEFRSIRPQKSAKGQRVYSRRDVDTLAKVKELLYAHRFTIEGARRKLREGGIEPIAVVAPSPANDEAPEQAEAQASQARETAHETAQELQRIREVLLGVRRELLEALNELDSLPSG